jgi:glycosyltransferase involved in cell wall biosynthesis
MTIQVSALILWDKYSDPITTQKYISNNPRIITFEFGQNTKKPYHFLSHSHAIYKILKQNNYNIIQLNGLRDLIHFWLLRIFLVKKPLLISTSLNSSIWKKKYINWLIGLYIYLFSEGYIALNSKNMNLMKKLGFPKDKICFIPNAFLTPQHFSHGIYSEKKPDSIRIVFVASVIRSKSPETIIYAISKLKERIAFIQVLLVGSTTIDKNFYIELIELIKKLRVNEQVKFTGQVSHNDSLDYCKSADIIVFPSKNEMMPRAVIEAMWLGKPVIATAVDGILDLITDHETGLLFTPGDADELARLIEELIEKPDLANKLASTGQKYVQEFCSLEKVSQAYKKFYEKILNKSYK